MSLIRKASFSELVHFNRNSEIQQKADVGEKIAIVGLGLLRIAFGHTVKVRLVDESLTFKEKKYHTLIKIAAIVLIILTLPVMALLAGIGCIGLALSKSHYEMCVLYSQKIDNDKFAKILQRAEGMPEANLRYLDLEPISPSLQAQKHDARYLDLAYKPSIDSHLELKLSCSRSITYNKITKEYTYISKAPPIKNVVISGGGAKGVILPGVITAFENHKIGATSFRDQLDYISGSSVGALTSCLVACGMTAENITKELKSVDFYQLLGKPAGFLPVNKCGKPILNFLRVSMQKSIKSILDSMDVTDYKAKLGNEESISNFEKVLEVLKLDPNNEADIEKMCITFSMLETLRQLNPHAFKHLTVTATGSPSGITYYFNAETAPHLEVALACRASAALPIILSSVEIDPSLLPGCDCKDTSFVDGGFFDNIPVSSMERKQGDTVHNQGEKGQNLQTLVLVFDHTKKTEKGQSPFLNVPRDGRKIYQPTWFDRRLRDTLPWALRVVLTHKRNTKTGKQGIEEIRGNYTQRNIPLQIPIKTTDFTKAKENEDEYIKKGLEQTTEYLKNHEDEAIYRSAKNFEDLREYLPELNCKQKWKLDQFLTKIALLKKHAARIF